jgi:hypothetical protein
MITKPVLMSSQNPIFGKESAQKPSQKRHKAAQLRREQQQKKMNMNYSVLLFGSQLLLRLHQARMRIRLREAMGRTYHFNQLQWDSNHVDTVSSPSLPSFPNSHQSEIWRDEVNNHCLEVDRSRGKKRSTASSSLSTTTAAAPTSPVTTTLVYPRNHETLEKANGNHYQGGVPWQYAYHNDDTPVVINDEGDKISHRTANTRCIHRYEAPLLHQAPMHQISPCPISSPLINSSRSNLLMDTTAPAALPLPSQSTKRDLATHPAEHHDERGTGQILSTGSKVCIPNHNNNLLQQGTTQLPLVSVDNHYDDASSNIVHWFQSSTRISKLVNVYENALDSFSRVSIQYARSRIDL